MCNSIGFDAEDPGSTVVNEATAGNKILVVASFFLTDITGLKSFVNRD